MVLSGLTGLWWHLVWWCGGFYLCDSLWAAQVVVRGYLDLDLDGRAALVGGRALHLRNVGHILVGRRGRVGGGRGWERGALQGSIVITLVEQLHINKEGEFPTSNGSSRRRYAASICNLDISFVMYYAMIKIAPKVMAAAATRRRVAYTPATQRD